MNYAYPGVKSVIQGNATSHHKSDQLSVRRRSSDTALIWVNRLCVCGVYISSPVRESANHPIYFSTAEQLYVDLKMVPFVATSSKASHTDSLTFLLSINLLHLPLYNHMCMLCHRTEHLVTMPLALASRVMLYAQYFSKVRFIERTPKSSSSNWHRAV